MKKVLAQQGDLILVIDELPKNVKEIKTGGRFVALRGEGVNTHEVIGTFSAYEDAGGTLWLKIDDAKVIHDEHGTTLLPAETIRRVIEREFDYNEMEARNVED